MKEFNIKLNIDTAFLYVLLFLCSLDFLNTYFYLTFIIVFIVLLLKRGKVFVSGTFVLLLLFGFSMMVFGFSYLYGINGINGLLKCFLYPISFLIGENLAFTEQGVTNKNKVLNYTLVLAFGMAFHGFLNFVYNLLSGSNQRNSIDIWTHSVAAATRQACLFVLLCGVFFWCFFLQKNKLYKVICGILLAAMVYYNTVTIASRTIIIMGIIGALFPMFLYVINLSQDRSTQRYKTVLSVFLALLTVVVLYFVFYYTNFFNFRVLIDHSNLVKRIQYGFFRDERNVSRSLYLDLMWKYPLGGNMLYSITNRYGHDILLSALNTGGIPSAVILICYFINFIYQGIKLFSMKQYSFDFRILITSVYVVALIQFALEPILDGEHWLFGCVLIISGMVNALIRHPQQESAEVTV